ncbi:MAG: hypothetical protein JRN68_07855 [Nitrososphaerota archaeon]|nr:hypothetical protein [Nitrososphaerota archaeon]
MNPARLRRFIKYLVIMLLSLEFVALIVIVALNLDVLLSLLIVVVMAAISSIIAARDAGYISLF